MAEQEKEKKAQVEWSFSFDKLSDSINEQLKKMGVGDEEVKTAHFEELVGGAASAQIELVLSVGQVTIRPAAEPDKLFEADLKYVGEIEYSVTGDVTKTIHLGQKKSPHAPGPFKGTLARFVNREELKWDIALGTSVPLSIEIDGGVGETHADLSGIPLKRLDIDWGVGELRVTLPSTDERYAVRLNGGVGASDVTVAPGAALTLDLNGGVGGMVLRVPANTAVRLDTEGGLGGISVPNTYRRVKGSDGFLNFSGVWETEGFSLANSQVTVKYRGGVGGLKVISG
jgi:hypothetical protein